MSLKVEAKGGKGGSHWDDGFDFEGVTKIHVQGGLEGIQFIQFEYVKDGNTIVRPIHAVSGRGMTQTFELDYPDEYITSVEGCHDKVMGAETGVITMLIFKTNKRTSAPFGLESASNFVLEKEGHKITGFHGKSRNMLHQIGVHVVPIPIIISTRGITEFQIASAVLKVLK